MDKSVAVKTERTKEESIDNLSSGGPTQQQALDDLQDYLMQAVYVYLYRKRSLVSQLNSSEVEKSAEDCVQESLSRVCGELDRFRGDSKFTTWGYRVVIKVAAGKLRG